MFGILHALPLVNAPIGLVLRDAIAFLQSSGELVTLTVHGEPVADIVPHGHRVRWLSGEGLRDQLRDRAADPALERELDVLVGDTLDNL